MADPDKVRAMIAEVARNHGVALSPDDPLMILQTINAMLIGEMVDAQEAALGAFKSEIEDMSNRWSIEINSKAERILNAALEAAEAAMKQRMADGARVLVEEVSAEVSKGLGQPLADGLKIANRNLLASAFTILAALIVFVAAVIH